MSERSSRYGRGSDAIFIGWRLTSGGTHLAQFTITAKEHPFFGFTVSEPVLRNLNLQVPRIPSHESKENEFRSSIMNGK
jgi:hypothetical protein